MPERIERFAGKVTIGLAGHIIICKGRQLINRFVERYRQPSARIIIAKQYIGNGRTRRLTRIPGFDNCGDVFIRPVYRYGAAVQQHQHHWFPETVQGLHQFFLDGRQVQS